MPQLLPLRPSIEHTPRPRQVVDLVDEDSAAVLGALQAATARALLAALAEAPATASDLAGRIDTSLQNVQYHLGKLDDAGLVTDVGTWTSTKGREMTVYGPTNERIELRLPTGRTAEPAGPRTPTAPRAVGRGD